jgi:hypothetical protein
LKVLNDTRQPYRQKILAAQFDGNEADLQEYLAEDPLNSILDYDGLLSPADYDAVYVYAFTEVCSYHSGKTYIDTYTDSDGIENRQKPQCGWATAEACSDHSNAWIAENGQVGTYGEWFKWNQLDAIFKKLQTDDNTFIPPLNTTSPLYSNLYTDGICIVTGAGQHFACRDAGGIYDSVNHKCGFTKEICQYYGTCYRETTSATGNVIKNCFMPTKIDQAQNFLGQSFPREWVRLNGCLDENASDTDNFVKTMRDIGNFFTNSGLRMFSDMAKNKKNWKEGMKIAFSDPHTIADLAMIILPEMMGLGTGPSMIAIAFVVGGMMADKALQVNRDFAQMPPSRPAEFSVGGWRSNHTDIPFKDQCKVTNIALTMISSTAHTFDVVFTTSTPHGYVVGDTLYHQGLSKKLSLNLSYIISQIPSTTTIKIQIINSGTLGSTIDPADVYVYARSLPNTKTYNYTKEVQGIGKLKDLYGVPLMKMSLSVGYVKGWVTKPLRPFKNDGQTRVSLSEGVDQIAGSAEQDFYIDVSPNSSSESQVPLFNGCNDSQFAENFIPSSCVNKQYSVNYTLTSWMKTNDFPFPCAVKGLFHVTALTELCLKATAIDSATGLIQNPNSGIPVSQGYEWMALQKYKRLCSERDTYGLGNPMVRAWDAPRINKTWCIPETPPAEWVNSDIGALNTTETIYARNRAWTSGVDPYSPEADITVIEQGGNYEVGDSAKYWFYQLVYDPKLFNLTKLWDEKLLNNNFSATTISEMRQYYCLEDYTKYYEAETLNLLDDRCWGYLSISTTNYSYTPMTSVGVTWPDMTTYATPVNFIG